MSFPTPTVCPRCGDQLSTPIPSHRRPGMVNQTCRNSACLHMTSTTITVADPPRPRPVSLPLEPALREAPPRPAAEVPSAIRRFEEAYQRRTTGKVIKQVRRELRLVSGDDGRSKRIGEGR